MCSLHIYTPASEKITHCLNIQIVRCNGMVHQACQEPKDIF